MEPKIELDILFQYIRTNNLDAVEKAIKANPSLVNAQAQDEDGNTALIIAILYDHLAIVQNLCEQGAELNIQDKHGKTALFHVCVRQPPNHREAVVNTIQACLARGATIKNNQGLLSLVGAIHRNNPAVRIFQDLIMAGFDAQPTNEDALETPTDNDLKYEVKAMWAAVTDFLRTYFSSIPQWERHMPRLLNLLSVTLQEVQAMKEDWKAKNDLGAVYAPHFLKNFDTSSSEKDPESATTNIDALVQKELPFEIRTQIREQMKLNTVSTYLGAYPDFPGDIAKPFFNACTEHCEPLTVFCKERFWLKWNEMKSCKDTIESAPRMTP